MNKTQLNQLHMAFDQSRPTYYRELVPVLKERLWNSQIPAYGYKWIKQQCNKVLPEGSGVLIKDGELPPPFILELELKERYKWEWRWQQLLRVQQRLSFWMEYTGDTASELLACADSFGYVFLPEIKDEKERRRKYNAGRKIIPKRLRIMDIHKEYGNPLLEELRIEIKTYKIRKSNIRWHIFRIVRGKGAATYAVQCDSRVRALRRLAYATGKSVTVLHYESKGKIPEWVDKNKILGVNEDEWRILEGRLVGLDSSKIGESKNKKRNESKAEEMGETPEDENYEVVEEEEPETELL